MKKSLPIVIVVVLVLLLLGGYFLWQNLTAAAPKATNSGSAQDKIKKVDLSSQPKWVQDLKVTAKIVKGGRLPSLMFTASGIPANTVKGLNYTAYFDTTNRGTQGSSNTKGPVDIAGKTEFSQSFDLGTCSSGTCLAYLGVNSLELELEFVGTSGETFSWAKTLALQ